MEERLILDCYCKTPEHIVRFWAWAEEDEITFEYQLIQHKVCLFLRI